MDAITIFKRVRAADEEISRLERQKRQRWDALTSLSAPQADPNGGSHGSRDPDKNGRIMADIDQLERKIRARKDRKEAETVAAQLLVDMLPDLEGEILHKYYIMKKGTTEIAREASYTPGYVRRIKRQGEQLLGILTPERVAGTLPAWYLRDSDGGKDV